MDVANAGKQLFFVDQILKHKGDPKEKTSFFRIKWKDYPSSDNKSKPWENLKTNVKLHEYLTSDKLDKIITKS